VRMEPQFMILGHAAGVVAALTVKANRATLGGFGGGASGGGGVAAVAVQDVEPAALASVLLADGQKTALPPTPVPTPKPPVYGCDAGASTGGGATAPRCLLYAPGTLRRGSLACPTIFVCLFLPTCFFPTPPIDSLYNCLHNSLCVFSLSLILSLVYLFFNYFSLSLTYTNTLLSPSACLPQAGTAKTQAAAASAKASVTGNGSR
jgi:hypothetical protein